MQFKHLILLCSILFSQTHAWSFNSVHKTTTTKTISLTSCLASFVPIYLYAYANEQIKKLELMTDQEKMNPKIKNKIQHWKTTKKICSGLTCALLGIGSVFAFWSSVLECENSNKSWYSRSNSNFKAHTASYEEWARKEEEFLRNLFEEMQKQHSSSNYSSSGANSNSSSNRSGNANNTGSYSSYSQPNYGSSSYQQRNTYSNSFSSSSKETMDPSYRKGFGGKIYMPREEAFKVLGISSTSPKSQIKQTYFKLARENHPDKFPSPQYSDADRSAAKSKIQKINDAYEVLK